MKKFWLVALLMVASGLCAVPSKAQDHVIKATVILYSPEAEVIWHTPNPQFVVEMPLQSSHKIVATGYGGDNYQYVFENGMDGVAQNGNGNEVFGYDYRVENSGFLGTTVSVNGWTRHSAYAYSGARSFEWGISDDELKVINFYFVPNL